MFMLNIFALRSTDPKALYSHGDPVGRDNDLYLRWYTDRWNVDRSVACWGTHGKLLGRGAAVADLELGGKESELLCFGHTAAGHPKHPLYLSRASTLEPFVPPTEVRR
jgi:hypothetical protein